MNKVLIIGSISTGTGGVTTCNSKLIEKLKNINYFYEFYDIKDFNFFIFFKTFYFSKIIHSNIHNPIKILLLVFICKLFKKKCIISMHGNYRSVPSLIRNISEDIYIYISDKIIVQNHNTFHKISKRNKNIILTNTNFISDENKKVHFTNQIHKELLFKLKNNYKKIFLTYSGSFTFINNNETYGIEFLYNYFAKITNYALIIFDPNNSYNHLKNNNLFKNIFFINYVDSLTPYLKSADYYIRNTITDGDSLFINEALNCNVCVLATSVVKRPDGVCTFEYSNESSLTNLINKNPKFIKYISKSTVISYLDIFPSVYEKF